MEDGRSTEKNRMSDHCGDRVPFCTKGNTADFNLLIGLFAVLIISLGIWLTILPHSLAAQVTMDVYQTSGNKVFGTTTSLDIFGETAADGDAILHPYSSGSYTFAVYNNSGSSSLPYSIAFEAENNYDIPIAVTIQKNTEYIFGSGSAMASLTTCSMSNLMLSGKATDYYTINWKWITTSDEADTAFGNAAVNEDMWYTLTITATGELDEVSSGSGGGSGSTQNPDVVQGSGIAQGTDSIREVIQVLIGEAESILAQMDPMGRLSVTGDNFNITVWVVLAGVSFAGVIILLLLKRRRKEDEDEDASENR